MPEPHNKTDEETRQEVIRRLKDGESPEDISDESDMPSRRTIYNIKDEWEKQQARQEEMERDVFRDTQEADRDDIIDVLEQAGVGIKQDGEPKAKVEKALNAIEFDSGWDDPHYVADMLIEEAGMTPEWANRIVRKAYGNPDFPRGGGESRDNGHTPRPQRGGRGRERTRDDYRSGRGRGRGRERDGRESEQNRSSGDRQLRKEMQELRSTVGDLAEVVSEAVSDDDDSGQMVRITRDDGSTIEVPANHPAAADALAGGGGEEKDFMEKLRDAKQAGLIPDPDDFQQEEEEDFMDLVEKMDQLGLINDDEGADAAEVMAEMMEQTSKQFAEAQESVAAQMSTALEQLSEEQEEDDDELTMEDLRDFWEEKEKEDRIDQLADELDKTREEIRSEMRKSNRSSRDPSQSEDVVMQRDKLEHEKDQLEMVNDTLQSLPDQMTTAVRDGLLPLYKEMEFMQEGDGHPLWSPPGEQQREQPDIDPFSPDEAAGAAATTGGSESESTPAERDDYPEADSHSAEREQGDEIAERGQDVREKLGLNDDDTNAESSA